MHMAGNYRISLAAVMNGASALGLLDNDISKRHFDFCFILFYPEKKHVLALHANCLPRR